MTHEFDEEDAAISHYTMTHEFDEEDAATHTIR